jgi:hypothetical protein
VTVVQDPATLQSIAVNNAVSAAKNLPDLIAKAQEVDPSLAAALQGKALALTTGPVINAVVAVVTYAAGKFGLGWDEGTCAIVAWGAIVVSMYVMKWVNPERVTGLFKAKPVTSTTATTL